MANREWGVDMEEYAQDLDAPVGLASRWAVMMIKSGIGKRVLFFNDYNEALMIASAKKEDCELVSVYERETDGWTKCFNV